MNKFLILACLFSLSHQSSLDASAVSANKKSAVEESLSTSSAGNNEEYRALDLSQVRLNQITQQRVLLLILIAAAAKEPAQFTAAIDPTPEPLSRECITGHRALRAPGRYGPASLQVVTSRRKAYALNTKTPWNYRAEQHMDHLHLEPTISADDAYSSDQPTPRHYRFEIRNDHKHFHPLL